MYKIIESNNFIKYIEVKPFAIYYIWMGGQNFNTDRSHTPPIRMTVYYGLI